MDEIVSILVAGGREIFAPTTAAFALAAIGLNFHFGMTGLLNMGHAGFMLLGMYGYAITVREGGSMWLGLLVSVLAAMAIVLNEVVRRAEVHFGRWHAD